MIIGPEVSLKGNGYQRFGLAFDKFTVSLTFRLLRMSSESNSIMLFCESVI